MSEVPLYARTPGRGVSLISSDLRVTPSIRSTKAQKIRAPLAEFRNNKPSIEVTCGITLIRQRG